jgi:hypothetical protein
MSFNTPTVPPPQRLPYRGQTTDAVELYRQRQSQRQGRASTIHTFLGPEDEIDKLGKGAAPGKYMLG